jgi:hypothetical protein
MLFEALLSPPSHPGKCRDNSLNQTTTVSFHTHSIHYQLNNSTQYSLGYSLILKEEHRLRVFENKVLRRISGPKRDEVTGGWRKLHNEELHNL